MISHSVRRGWKDELTAAEMLSIDVGQDESVALIRYSSASSAEVTIRWRWQEEDGRPVIVAAEPAA